MAVDESEVMSREIIADLRPDAMGGADARDSDEGIDEIAVDGDTSLFYYINKEGKEVKSRSVERVKAAGYPVVVAERGDLDVMREASEAESLPEE